MTVLSGGISGGHLWDGVDVQAPNLGKVRTFAPMLPMRAEDLGGMSDPGGGVRWARCLAGKCPAPGNCSAWGACCYWSAVS